MTDTARQESAELSGQPFDLNIDRVLNHWPIAFAVRELISNALDEQMITGTAEPIIEKMDVGKWRIRDFGRGVHYEHLTQNESPEKHEHPSVIGQFGIGLKDALAVFDRRGIDVTIHSPHGDITTARLAKAGFPDVVTLNGVVASPSDPNFVGTEVVLAGVDDDEVKAARSYFLRYSGETTLETTKYGSVLARSTGMTAGRIYVKGLLVAEEPNFLFSYNVTQLNASLRRALNRERTNVGRGAYSDRVKDILKESRSAEVAGPLTADLARFTSGRMHDELSWKDVAIHACRVLQGAEKVVFVTAWQLGLASISYARGDGYRPIVVPDDIAAALGTLEDLDGNSMFNLDAFQKTWNESFSFNFVDVAELTPKERTLYDLTDHALSLARVERDRYGIDAVLISETMRLNERGAEVLGVWEGEERRIVIRRDQLRSAESFFGTLLHEAVHALTGWPDGTLDFEEALTRCLGLVASGGIT